MEQPLEAGENEFELSILLHR